MYIFGFIYFQRNYSDDLVYNFGVEGLGADRKEEQTAKSIPFFQFFSKRNGINTFQRTFMLQSRVGQVIWSSTA